MAYKKYNLFFINGGEQVERLSTVEYKTEDDALRALRGAGLGEFLVLPVYVNETTRTDSFVCTDEVTGASITDTSSASFTASWTNPGDWSETLVRYRVQGDPTWLVPNDPGNATGDFVSYESYALDGLTDGIHYEMIIQNRCGNGEYSAGVVVDAIATTPL
jgi:hypothetical protein